MSCVPRRCYCFLLSVLSTETSAKKRGKKEKDGTNSSSQGDQTAPGNARRGWKRDSDEAKVAETRLGEGMARRQGGSFNSILAERKSPLASLSSEQQGAGGKKLTR